MPDHEIQRRTLDEPAVARPRARHLLDPRRGWFRRLERRTSLLLSRHVFPRFPVLNRGNDVLLDRYLTVAEAEIPMVGLSPAWDGATVLLITDIHAGPFLSRQALERSIRRLEGLNPDVILLGGDFVTSRVEELEDLQPTLRSLSASHGVFGVLGNHDHYTGHAAEVLTGLESAGIEILHNRSVELRRQGQPLRLAGIDDLLVGDPDLDAALAGRTTGTPTILLSHHPDVFFDAARRGVALVLSGHTHGGQIRVPGLPVLVRMSRYRLDDGRYRHQSSEILVSRGFGVVGLPFRLACRPEVALITLRHSASRVHVC